LIESGAMVLQVSPARNQPIITWEVLPADFVLPDDPVENLQQPLLAAALTDALGAAGQIKPEMLIGSNFGLAIAVNKKIVVKAPAWFLCASSSTRCTGNYSPELYAPFRRGTCGSCNGVSV
jgi:hypothetical protein